MKGFFMTLPIRIAFLACAFLLHACCKDHRYDFSPLPSIAFVKSPPAQSTDTALTFTRIYALKGKRNLYDSPTDFPRSSFQVPIALGSDTTTYIFEGANRIDTLSVSYDRKVQFISRTCGATLYIQNIRLSEPTSFSNVRISTDSSNVYSNNSYNFVVVVSI